MKTAISLPDDLYETAESVARFMDMPRSRFYALALAEYIDSHSYNKQKITDQLNEVYAQNKNVELPAGLAALRNLTKHDAW
ncbi:MAG: ChpI protein [Candidatus Margulisbacteria bacterium]|jgi:predicted transcriptional regulator|nr:ChpI protein [Candidatus Margulisiibacteriota bacterium]